VLHQHDKKEAEEEEEEKMMCIWNERIFVGAAVECTKGNRCDVTKAVVLQR